MMDGQLSIFDVRSPQEKRRPCEYSFKRYIGQRVATNYHVGIICGIEPYYTRIRKADGSEVVGINWDFTYEKNGEHGIWIDILEDENERANVNI